MADDEQILSSAEEGHESVGHIDSSMTPTTTSTPVGPSNPTSAAAATKAKAPRLRSNVWDHFTKFTDKEDGQLKGKCNYCSKTYCCHSKRHGGTSTLKNHVLSCIQNPNNVDPRQPNLSLKPSCAGEDTGSLSSWKFDQKFCRKKMVQMIVKDELSFNHVDGEGFIEFVEALQPKFKITSRWTVSRDIYQLYLNEKEKLREFFRTSGVTVCLTTDTWTSVQKINYLCITAHYIDKDWTLHKKIINFCVVDSHKGEEMGRQIDGCLHSWGIARVFAITVDNVTSNDTCLNFLKERLVYRERDVLKGEHLHMRCTAHVLNLIVGDGMKVINSSIKRVREAVRFVRHSPSRLARFRECCEDDGIESKSLLCLDVATRWNSTYLMLSVAIKFEKAFERFEVKDPLFRCDLKDGVPTQADWQLIKTLIDILVVFYEVTLKVSASLHVTSHLVFHEIDTIGSLLREWVDSSNPEIKAMATKMQLKYDKYWGDVTKMNKLIYIGFVVDPRYKFAFISYYFREEYGELEGSQLVGDVKSALFRLYEHYQSLHQPQTQSQSQSSVSNQEKDVAFLHPMKKVKYSRSDKWQKVEMRP